MADSRTRRTVPVVSIYSGRNGPFMVVYTDGRRLHSVEDSRLFLGNRIRRDSTQTKMNNNTTTQPLTHPTCAPGATYT
ncbi:hypothetical protein OS493_032259 [Desmophyllum pertusum]|uniref:Uncharacterized protein n=1 Tax=Desmophyllum pertusum TaxID=174260 RepID=A0A9X0CUS6_9CNID|nr:hypothetical protein OS493_032259 [Desmophyllum pertusum]